MSNILQKALDAHYEDDLTKGWIINSLSKLSSCPKFPSSPAINEINSLYSRSKICDLYQRANEYKRLNKFKWALKQSSQLVVDPSLNFLSNFVQKSLERGAKPYDSKRTVASWVASLALENKDLQTSGINFESYERKDKKIITDEEQQSALKVKGPQKWTSEGYKEDQPVNKPITMQTGDKITQSISSSAFEKKVKQGIGSGVGSSSGGGFKMGGITSISSENYAGSGSNTNTTFKPSQTNIAKPQAVKENPEKQKLASDIFKGIGESSGKNVGGGLFSSMNVNEKSKGLTKNTNVFGNKATIANKSNNNTGGTIDLLDLNDPEDGNNNNFNENPTGKIDNNLLMAFGNKPEEKPLSQMKKDNNLFANLQNKQAKPFSKLTQKFQVEQFENYWETMPEELIEVFESKIRSEQDFKNMTENIGIDIIEIIENEIICAGLNEKKDIILIYGIYNPTGNMELRIKAKTSEEMAKIMKIIKLYAI